MRTTTAGFIGLLAGAVALGVAELSAAFAGPQAAPLIAVGGAGIDRTPEWLKSFAIRTFGENDKQVLLGGIALGVAIFAVVIGLIARKRRLLGVAGMALFGVVGVLAALSRPDAGPVDALPAVLGTLAGSAALLALFRTGEGVQAGAGEGRRGFLVTAGGVAALAAGGGVLWKGPRRAA